MKPTLPVILVLFLCLFAATDLYAATLTVTKVEDTNDGVCDADCSLREAVSAAAPGDTVVFSTFFNTPQTITLTLGQIAIDKNLTITGTGQDVVTISGNNAGRIFNITGNVNVSMSGMKLRDGKVGTTSEVDAVGGAIRMIGGSLNLTNIELAYNTALYPPLNTGDGGAVATTNLAATNLNVNHNISYGPAIAATTATVTDSVISDNGYGIDGRTVNITHVIVERNSFLGVGGEYLTVSNSTISGNGRGIASGDAASTMMIENSIVSGNTPDAGLSNNGFAIISNTVIRDNRMDEYGAGILNGGTMHILNSAIINNFAARHGGGIANYGDLFLTNSTVSGNTANGGVSEQGLGGGIYAGVDSSSHLTLTNSTISNNRSTGKGGGVRQDDSETTTIQNSIIAGNTSILTNEKDVSGAFTSHGNNLIGNTTGSIGWIASDLLNLDPILAPLADNGGTTLTHALLPGSPAIDAGNNSVAIDPQNQMPLTTDQRGFLRFYGGTVDIGAYEEQPLITGSITYGNVTSSPTPRFVSGVLLTAAGSPTVSAASRADGTYTLGGFGSGAYTITPSKTGGANGVSSFDAGLIAKHVAGVQTLSGNQSIVADVSGNGTLSSFDAGQIARYTAGLNGFGSSGNWIFVPASRTYSSVNSSMSGEDFIALLMGDVSGNWVLVSGGPFAVGSKDDRVVSSALTNVRASATIGDVSGNWSPGNTGGNVTVKERAPGDVTARSFTRAFPPERQECEGPVGNRIVTTAAMCTAFAEARADAMRVGQNRLRKRAASLSGSIGRRLTEAVPSGAATGGLVSANRYPIMARKDSLQSPATAVGSDTHREIDRLIGESLADYCNRRSVEDMEKAKAKARAEEELRKCLPKKGELPNWADDWLANVWQGGENVILTKHDRLPVVVDPDDPNVMWRVGATDDRYKRVKGIDGCLFKSMDGGEKWDVLHYTYMNQWKYVSSLAIAHENGKTILLAGVMGEPFSFNSGIMRSDDGGQRWYRVCDGFAALSVAFDPNDPQNAIAEIVAPPDLEKAFATSRVVFSTDGGKHWMTATRNGVAIETNSESKMRDLAALKKHEPYAPTTHR